MSSPRLPPYVDWRFVHQRLQEIFPTDIEGHGYCTREMAGKTVFVMLYLGALEGEGQYLAPKHVVRMTDVQAARISNEERRSYAHAALTRGFQPEGKRWFADNSREPIRDETLRQGFVRFGAVVERSDIPKTSSHPRYALATDFAELFNPKIVGEALRKAIEAWVQKHLDPAVLVRTSVIRASQVGTNDVLIHLPDGSSRRMSAGPSAIITRAVVEEFAPRFLEKPSVIFISESGRKVVAADAEFAKTIGLHIDQTSLLPDVILVDVGQQARDLLLVFVEVVHSDGPIDTNRREKLLHLATSTRLPSHQIAFVTAYLERGATPARTQFARLAWNSFAWFASEPEAIVALVKHLHRPATLRAMMTPLGGS